MAEVFETTDMDLAEQVLSPVGVLVIPEFVSGRARYHSDSERHYSPGDVCLTALAEHGYTAALEDVRVNIAVIDPVLLSQVADAESGRTRQPVRFTGREPVSRQAAGIWKDTCAYIRDSVLPRPEAASQPLIAAAAARMLVAAAACVTIRAIQLVFRRHLDSTPTEYLRRVRLDHARQDLIAADPARDSVTAIAYRWGFPNPSRFAAQYRQTYGVRPSHTLRRG